MNPIDLQGPVAFVTGSAQCLAARLPATCSTRANGRPQGVHCTAIWCDCGRPGARLGSSMRSTPLR